MKHMSRWPVNSLHKEQWRGALTFSFICAWINAWVNNREAGDLRRHRAHYDVTVMGHVITKHDIDNILCYMKKDSRLFLIKFTNELSRFYVWFSCSWKFNEYCSSWDQRYSQVIRNDFYWSENFCDGRWIYGGWGWVGLSKMRFVTFWTCLDEYIYKEILSPLVWTWRNSLLLIGWYIASTVTFGIRGSEE